MCCQQYFFINIWIIFNTTCKSKKARSGSLRVNHIDTTLRKYIIQSVFLGRTGFDREIRVITNQKTNKNLLLGKSKTNWVPRRRLILIWKYCTNPICYFLNFSLVDFFLYVLCILYSSISVLRVVLHVIKHKYSDNSKLTFHYRKQCFIISNTTNRSSPLGQ